MRPAQLYVFHPPACAHARPGCPFARLPPVRDRGPTLMTKQFSSAPPARRHARTTHATAYVPAHPPPPAHPPARGRLGMVARLSGRPVVRLGRWPSKFPRLVLGPPDYAIAARVQTNRHREAGHNVTPRGCVGQLVGLPAVGGATHLIGVVSRSVYVQASVCARARACLCECVLNLLWMCVSDTVRRFVRATRESNARQHGPSASLSVSKKS